MHGMGLANLIRVRSRIRPTRFATASQQVQTKFHKKCHSVSFCVILLHSVSGQIKQFSWNQRLIEFFKEEPTLQLQLHTVLLWASVCLLRYCYGPNHVTLSNLDSCLDVCSSMVSVSVILTAWLLLLRLELHTSSPLLPSRSRELPHEHQLFCVCVWKVIIYIVKQLTLRLYMTAAGCCQQLCPLFVCSGIVRWVLLSIQLPFVCTNAQILRRKANISRFKQAASYPRNTPDWQSLVPQAHLPKLECPRPLRR